MSQGLDSLLVMVAGAAMVWLICGCSPRQSGTSSAPTATSAIGETGLPPEVDNDPATATQQYLKNFKSKRR
jgi:hypothetical protein